MNLQAAQPPDECSPLLGELSRIIDRSDISTWVVSEPTESPGGLYHSDAFVAVTHDGVKVVLHHNLAVTSLAISFRPTEGDRPLSLSDVYRGTVHGMGAPFELAGEAACRLFGQALGRWRTSVHQREVELEQFFTERLLTSDTTRWRRLSDSSFHFDSAEASADLVRKEKSFLSLRRSAYVLLITSLKGPRFEFAADEAIARRLFHLLDAA